MKFCSLVFVLYHFMKAASPKGANHWCTRYRRLDKPIGHGLVESTATRLDDFSLIFHLIFMDIQMLSDAKRIEIAQTFKNDECIHEPTHICTRTWASNPNCWCTGINLFTIKGSDLFHHFKYAILVNAHFHDHSFYKSSWNPSNVFTKNGISTRSNFLPLAR